MDIAALKEVLQDRLGKLDQATEKYVQYTHGQTYLEDHRDELRFCLRLVEQWRQEEEYPLLELSEYGVRRIDNPLPDDWGAQPRGDWPNSMFGGADVLS